MQVQCQDEDCEDHWSHDPQGHFGHNKWAAEWRTRVQINVCKMNWGDKSFKIIIAYRDVQTKNDNYNNNYEYIFLIQVVCGIHTTI